MPDFYFVYGYNRKAGTAGKVCRRIKSNFQLYAWSKRAWVDDPELCRIYIGEDIYYDEVTEAEALKIIEASEKARA